MKILGAFILTIIVLTVVIILFSTGDCPNCDEPTGCSRAGGSCYEDCNINRSSYPLGHKECVEPTPFCCIEVEN